MNRTLTIAPLFVLLLVICGSSAAQQPAEGCYLTTHPIVVQSGAPIADIVVPAMDHFGLRRESKSTYEFDLLVEGDYGHMCEATGKLGVTKLGKRVILKLLPDEDSQAIKTQSGERCEMTVELKSGVIVINANTACNNHFGCGVRAGIYELQFRTTDFASERAISPCFQNAH